MFHPAVIRIVHVLIVALFVVAPLVALARAGRAQKRNQSGPASAFIATLLMGLLLGLGLCLVYAFASQGKLIFTQVLLAGYFATALLVIVKWFDLGMRVGLARALGLNVKKEKFSFADVLRSLVLNIVRLSLLAFVALPYIMAAVMTYRPKVAPATDPMQLLSAPFERVSFRATDNTPIVGWWIPALNYRSPTRWEGWGKNTVIVCPGLAASKANTLPFCRRLVPGGFNLLIIDLRAHGESGGQLTTFGDLERRDVLGAVRWTRAMHPDQSQKIFGLGASMGSVALIAAAADDSVEGRAIDAIATYAAYDDLSALTESIANQRFVKPFNTLLKNFAFPVASYQVGADLTHFSPAELTEKIWPRPILFIHGEKDEIIDFTRGQELYDRAPQPKYNYWIPNGSHNAILQNETAAKVVVEFFKVAQPLPVI